MIEELELRPLEHDELSLLYQVTVQDLASFKSLQWTLVNYALLAFAAIIGIPHINNITIELCGRFFLCLIATVVFGFVLWILWQLKISIDVRRTRLERIFEKFTDVFTEARGEKKQVSATEMAIFLSVILTIGIGFVWWLVYAVKLNS